VANTQSVKTATDGSETPAAILVDDVDASTHGDQNGGLYLMGSSTRTILFLIIPGLRGTENSTTSAGYLPERQHSGACNHLLIYPSSLLTNALTGRG
jgi:hypothetical protein